MISIFRKIRRQSLLDNRITRYLTYAVGEIFLIVIGIFIALQINNWNEARKSTREVYSQLAQVHDDLGQTLNTCDLGTAVYAGKDDVIRDILTGKTTAEDYKDPEKRPYYLSAAYDIFVPNFRTSGYTTLVSNAKAIPRDLLPILKDLKRIYNIRLDIVLKNQESMWDSLMQLGDWTMKNTTWYAEGYFDDTDKPISDERIAFYVSDPNYRKFVRAAYTDTIANHYVRMIQLRNDTVKTYEELSQLLELEERPGLSCNVDPDEMQQLVGTYLVEESSNTLDFEKASIRIEGDHLMFAPDSPEESPYRIFPLREKSWWRKFGVFKIPTFTDTTGLFYYADVAEDGTVTGLSARIRNTFIKYKKVQ